MSSHVALLRGINVGGKNLIAMAELRDLVETLGFAGAKTLLQSGNLVFQAGRRKAAQLEKLLEAETAKRFGVAPDYMVRTAEEWQTIIKRNPFSDEATRDPGHLLVICLKNSPNTEEIKALQAAIVGPETIHVDGR